MELSTQHFWTRAVPALVLAALALALVPALPVARAETVRTGDEPWYSKASADARQRARALFAQALDKHQQLLRGEALVLYEQALALWDNPDIQWNLSLVLEDLGQYLRAYEQLGGALRWEEALGPDRLRQVRDRMQVLETQRLARIEAYLEEPAAVITLDGKPWLPRGGRRSSCVLPGEHYLAARKPGYFSVTRSVYVKAGELARVPLVMDEDRRLEKRRWKEWKPWTVMGAGLVTATVGAGLEWRAYADRNAVAHALASCKGLLCDQRRSGRYDRAVLEHELAIGAFVVGGAVAIGGLALAWINQPRAPRAEARSPSRIELTPVVSPHRAELGALIRF